EPRLPALPARCELQQPRRALAPPRRLPGGLRGRVRGPAGTVLGVPRRPLRAQRAPRAREPLPLRARARARREDVRRVPRRPGDAHAHRRGRRGRRAGRGQLHPGATPAQLAAVHAGIRKFAHFAEYLILSVLLYRALRAERRWSLRAAALALALAGLYSVGDELHQWFVPGRLAGARDCLIDVSG